MVVESRSGEKYTVKLRDFLYIAFDILEDVVQTADEWVSDVYAYADGIDFPFEVVVQTKNDILVSAEAKDNCISPEKSKGLRGEILQGFEGAGAVQRKKP
jgi:hypothetical protein